MADIRFHCPSCKRKLAADADDAEREICCPACGTMQNVPALRIARPVQLTVEQEAEGKLPSRNAVDVEEPRYAAFISYRHVEPDRHWAKWLHTALETYRVPKRLVAEHSLPPRLGKLFRDEEELPASADLSREIESALEQSRFLIVVCSPQTPSSEWVNAEVSQFRALGRHDQILALLVEGEPSQSFPRALREIRHIVDNENGTGWKQQVEEVEPLAADVRLTRSEGNAYLRRMAKLRMLACILGVPLDDLRLRDRERQRRRNLRNGFIAAVIATLVLVTALAVKSELTQRQLAAEALKSESTQRQLARAQRQVARENDYLNHISLAERELSVGNCQRANELLEECPPKRRQWEWRHLKRVSNDSELTIGAAHACPNADGTRLAYCISGRPGIFVLNTQTGESIEVCHKYSGPCTLALSPDGKRLAFVKFESGRYPQPRIIEVWDVAERKQLSTVTGHSGTIRAIRFSHSGKLLASASQDGQDGTVLITDLDKGTLARRLAGRGVCLAFSPDDRLLYCSGVVWDLQSRRTAMSFRDGGSVRGSAFQGNDRLAISRDGTLQLWDIQQNKEIWRVRGQYYGIAFSPDGTRCATVEGGRLRILDASDGTELARFRSQIDGRRLALSFTSDGKEVIWSNSRATHYFNVLSAGQDTVVHPIPAGPVTFSLGGAWGTRCGAGSPDGEWIVVPSDSDREGGAAIRVLASGTGKERLVLKGFSAEVACWAFSPDGKMLAAAASASTPGMRNGAATVPTATDVIVWDLATGQCLQCFKGAVDGTMQLAFSPDNRTLAGASVGDISRSVFGDVRLWNLASGQEIRRLSGGTFVAFSPDGKRLATACDDYHVGTVGLWDIASGRQVDTLRGHTGIITCLAFSPTGKQLASAGMDSTVRVYDMPEQRIRSVCTATNSMVHGVAFSSDGKRLASANADGMVRLWDPMSGREVLTLRGHSSAVYSVSFSNDGQRLISAGGEVRVWYASYRHPAWEAKYPIVSRAPGVQIKPVSLLESARRGTPQF